VWKSWPPAGKRRGEWWQKTWPIIGPEAGFVWIPRCRRSALVLLLATLPLHGCVWRGGATEHYLGPVLFRYTPSQEDKPAINQVVALGVLGEGGRQWGLSLGVVERTTVSPQFIGGTEPGATPDSPRWSTPLNPLRSPAAGRWHLSPFYLRVHGVQPPGLLARRLYGFQLVAGPEARAASLGEVTMGYDRYEVVSIPAQDKDAKEQEDTYSVLGIFAVSYGNPWTMEPLVLRQFFATGRAARQAVANSSFQRYFGRKTGEIILEAEREIERQREKERAR
jgi:hypothetical protein